MTDFSGMNTDSRLYEADYRRAQLTAAFARHPARHPGDRNGLWRRLTLRSH
jgi:hypothetical protein